MTPLEQATQAPGHVRVRLRYTTPHPTTESALIMQEHLGVPGPYLEEVCVLLPTQRAFSLLEAYLEPFRFLQDQGIVPPASELHSYKVETGDQPDVLAYVIP